MTLPFPSPNKTVVLADALDEITWTDLPEHTHCAFHQCYEGGSDDFFIEEGSYTGTFGVPGRFYFILSAEGYTTTLFEVFAVAATE